MCTKVEFTKLTKFISDNMRSVTYENSLNDCAVS